MLPEAQSSETRIGLGLDARNREFYDTWDKGEAKQKQIDGFLKFRKEVLEGTPCLDEAQLQEYFGLSKQDITGLIDAQMVISFEDHAERLFPLFQFDPETERPYQEVQAVNSLLFKSDDNWGKMLWWTERHELFPNECAPKDMLLDESSRSQLVEISQTCAESDWY